MMQEIFPDNFRADLHCHSTFSDGSLTPFELIDLAKDRQLQGLAITDHDTVASYLQNDSLFSYATSNGITLLPGIEFSCSHLNESIHVLAYSFDPAHHLLLQFCQEHALRRKQRNEDIFSKLCSIGISLNEEETVAICQLTGNYTLGRPHIARALMEKGVCKTYDEAFKRYIGSGQPCYSSGPTFSLERTLSLIKSINAISVLAHPHLIKDNTLLHTILKQPFDGIECYYASFGIEKNQRWIKQALKDDKIQTGGSDFHGTAKPQNRLGASWIGLETFNQLKQRYEENRLLRN